MLPPGTTQEQVEGFPYQDVQERLEYLDNNNGEKVDYLELIQRIAFDNGLDKNTTDTLVNAVDSYSQAK